MMKGIYKGFKYITHIFVVKEEEEEIQIGMPTDVKHVAHIGVDGPSGSAPSWMNDFKAAPEFSSSLGSSPIPESAKSTTTSRREHASVGGQEDVVASSDHVPKARKKHKRKKAKSASSPKASSSSSPSRSSRPTKSKLKNNNTHDHDHDDDHLSMVSVE